VCVVGSGAGGGVIAGMLAEAGLKVVVLEAAGYFNEADFNQSELWAFQNLYWRGGPTPTADFNVALQAGTTLGGGTTINWTTSLRTTPWVRAQWANEHGLEGVDGPEFDRHLDAVSQRISVGS
jgi:choline dehydrogenase-like flavoprotein